MADVTFWSAGHEYLRFGDRLPSVGVLQKLLGRAGARLDVDGIFGPKTLAAVLEFQRRHHPLRQDGLVGIQTWARLTEGLNLPIVDCVDVFDAFGSVELMSCSFMSGSDGPPMLQELAYTWGVPVSAGVQTQLAGGTATFRFEGPTRTAFPDAGGLKQWCRSLPDFPKQNASFPH